MGPNGTQRIERYALGASPKECRRCGTQVTHHAAWDNTEINPECAGWRSQESVRPKEGLGKGRRYNGLHTRLQRLWGNHGWIASSCTQCNMQIQVRTEVATNGRRKETSSRRREKERGRYRKEKGKTSDHRNAGSHWRWSEIISSTWTTWRTWTTNITEKDKIRRRKSWRWEENKVRYLEVRKTDTRQHRWSVLRCSGAGGAVGCFNQWNFRGTSGRSGCFSQWDCFRIRSPRCRHESWSILVTSYIAKSR